MIKLTVDGNSVEVPEGTTVLKAAQMAGSKIPTLCEFPALKPYGGCRLCVVEIEGFRTLQASCTLPASNGMVVRTATPKVLQARKFVLSMLFSERNHYCMYCQKTGGDCDLQNAAYGEGMTYWPIQPNWSPFPVDASHPHYVIDHNRCILCRRCVRACGELVGNYTLSIENRGHNCILVADNGLPIGKSSCIRCGTCLQVCPTGAIIDRHSAYIGKDVNTEHIESVCVGCSVGCNIEMLVKDNQLVRIDGNWSSPLNGGVLCEIGHFNALEQAHPRIKTPLVRKNGALVPASWDEALDTLVEHLKPLAGKNGAGVAAMASTRLPAEVLSSFKALFKDSLGSSLVTSSEENATFAVQRHAQNGAVSLNGSLDVLKNADCVVAVGVDLVSNHQVAGFFVKRNQPFGTRLVVIDPAKSKMSEIADYALRLRPGTDRDLLLGIAAEIARQGLRKGELPPSLDLAQVSLSSTSQVTGVDPDAIRSVSSLIALAQNPAFVYGKGITRDYAPQALNALVVLAHLAGAQELIHTKGEANSMAALRIGLEGIFEPQGHQAVYLALGDEVPSDRLVSKLDGVPFLAIQASYLTPVVERADVVFPVTAWMEQEGHYLNMEGRLQEARQAVQAAEGVWSNAAVLEAIASRLGSQAKQNWMDEIEHN